MINRTMFQNGLTVRELKEIVKDWPEYDENGDPCEVWIGYGNLSRQVCEVSTLNLRHNDKQEWADLILVNDITPENT